MVLGRLGSAPSWSPRGGSLCVTPLLQRLILYLEALLLLGKSWKERNLGESLSSVHQESC